MEELWGISKENLIKNIGEPHERRIDEERGIEEITYFEFPDRDFSPQKEITYVFTNGRLVMISTGYLFKENLFKQFELYHDSLIKAWKERLKKDPIQPTFEDEEGNKVTIWNERNTEIVVFFNNDPSEPRLVVVQKYKPQNS